jgi:asparagine synthase (glutamine-hydrolysing)
MCGICGWYRRDGAPVEQAVLESQCRAIVHRGPDDEGIHLDGDVGIGIRRLSIIDVAGGHQPMTSEDGAVSVVCNGEIVNFPALRRELQSLGHRFRTSSDVEVILHGFLAWEDGIWRRLEGMFAVALWDARDRSLRLVRDPLGIKPLFYATVGSGLAFGSELKALAPVPGLSFVPRPASIDCYFAFGHVLAGRAPSASRRRTSHRRAVLATVVPGRAAAVGDRVGRTISRGAHLDRTTSPSLGCAPGGVPQRRRRLVGRRRRDAAGQR